MIQNINDRFIHCQNLLAHLSNSFSAPYDAGAGSGFPTKRHLSNNDEEATDPDKGHPQQHLIGRRDMPEREKTETL